MTNFPVTFDDDSSLYVAVNNLRTKLTSGIDDATLVIPVTSTTGFPDSGFITVTSNPAVITNPEAISYSSKDATNFYATARGADGTSAKSHGAGANVDLNVIAIHHNALKDSVIALEHFVGVSGSESFLSYETAIVPGSSNITVTSGIGKVTIDLGTDVVVNTITASTVTGTTGAFGGTINAQGLSISNTISGTDLVVSNTITGADAVISDTVSAQTGDFSLGLLVSGIPVSTNPPLTVRETDGSPEVTGVHTIVVTTGTLTDNGSGVVTIDTGAGGGGGGGVTDHGALTGLGDDDHPQYIRVDGTRAFTGSQSLGDNQLTNVGGITSNSGTFSESLAVSGSPVLIDFSDLVDKNFEGLVEMENGLFFSTVTGSIPLVEAAPFSFDVLEFTGRTGTGVASGTLAIDGTGITGIIDKTWDSTRSTKTALGANSVAAGSQVSFESSEVSLWDRFSWTMKTIRTFMESVFNISVVSLDFDGSTTSLGNATEQDIGIANAFSIAMWVLFDLDTVDETLLDIGPASGNINRIKVRHLGTVANDPLEVNLYNSSGTLFKQYRYESVLPTGRWLGIAFTWDGTTLRTFVDGFPETPSSTPTDSVGTMTNTNRRIALSTSTDLDTSSTTEELDGRLHYVALWSEALDYHPLTDALSAGDAGSVDLREDFDLYTQSASLIHWWRLGLSAAGFGLAGASYVRDDVSSGGIDISTDGENISDANIVVEAPSFSPLYFGSPLFFLDASDASTILLEAGGRVTDWLDQSREGNNATATSGSSGRPTMASGSINSLDVINFDGSNDGLVMDSNITRFDNMTLVFVATKESNTPTNQIIMGFDQYIMVGRSSVIGDNLGIGLSPQYSSGESLSTSARIVSTALVTVSGSGSGSFFVDGNQTIYLGTAADTGDVNLGASRLGRHPSVTSQTLNGSIAEVIYYPRVLHYLERRKVEEYLESKWATAALPTALSIYPRTSAVSLSFNGTNQRLGQDTQVSIGIANFWGIHLWVKSGSDTSNEALLDIGPSSGDNNRITIRKRGDVANDPLSIELYNHSGTLFKEYRFDNVLPTGTWVGVGVTWESVNLRIFIDGSLATPDSTPTDNTGEMIEDVRSISLASDTASSSFFTGSIHSASVWQSPLATGTMGIIGDSSQAASLDLAHNTNDYLSSSSLIHWFRCGLPVLGHEVGTTYITDEVYTTGGIDLSNNAANVSDSDITLDTPL